MGRARGRGGGREKAILDSSSNYKYLNREMSQKLCEMYLFDLNKSVL